MFAARNGSSGNTITKCKEGAWSSRSSAAATMARATPPCCGQCSARGGGLVVACGMNPRLGDLDPYHMATSAVDEAVRNCVAVGADPERIALLDNFCWGDCERPGDARLAWSARRWAATMLAVAAWACRSSAARTV